MPAARAWNATGHMVIASMAYDQLPPAQRTRWTELLKSHPDFDKWQAAAPKDAAGFDLGRYLFMRASTWPDDIRKSGSPYDHPVWHYVNYPLVPPDFPMQPAPTGTEDVLSAIDRCEKTVADPADPPADRAAHLAWLIHLVGDLQQPLHCGTMITPEFPAPDGDHGGNLFFVSVGGAPITLHWLWDTLPGNLLDGGELVERSTQLAAKFPRSSLPELTTARDPKAWSLEGRALCIDAVYRRGALPGGKEISIGLPLLPTGYVATARALADRRVALAGYRLADTLGK